MNEISKEAIFHTNFQSLTKGKERERVKSLFGQVLAQISFHAEIPEDLKYGIQISILKAILTLLDLGINPTAKEILPEYQVLIEENKEAFVALKPEKESNWMEECIAYGDKKAYHWDWKHYGSKELY